MPNKFTLQDMKQIAQSRGGKCLSSTYLGLKSPLEWRCKQGHRWSAIPGNVKRGRWCPTCAGRKKITVEDLQILAKAKGGRLLSKKYLGAKFKLTWECENRHHWKASPGSVRNAGTWCPVCSGRRNLSLAVLKKEAAMKGGKCLSTTYRNNSTPLKWQCRAGHIWSAPASAIRDGYWCRTCALDNWNPKHKLSIEIMMDLAAEHGGKCLSKKYKNTKANLEWQCSLGHKWSASASNIQKGQWCPECASGLGERICRAYFEQLFGRKFTKVRPDWLITKDKKRLELDGYCPELKLAFEHQGTYHYQHTKFFHRKSGSFRTRKEDDSEKQRVCKKHGVKLILIPEIPSMLKPLDVKEYIRLQCQKNQVKIPSRFNEVKVDLRKAYSPEALAELNQLAKKRGGACLAAEYLGNATKVSWVCKKGHQFEATPGNVKSGLWCAECAGNKKLSLKYFQKLAAKRGGQCLSSEYKNIKQKLDWKCKRGHTWSASPELIKRAWCPVCAGNEKGSIEEMQKIAAANGGQCLSKRYVNSQSHLTWKCKRGHTWAATPANVKRGTWCPRCRKKLSNKI